MYTDDISIIALMPDGMAANIGMHVLISSRVCDNTVLVCVNPNPCIQLTSQPCTHLCAIGNQGGHSSAQGVSSHVHIVDLSIGANHILQGRSNTSPQTGCHPGKALVHLAWEGDAAGLQAG